MEAEAVAQQESPEKPLMICPLSTNEVVDRCMLFVEALSNVGLYNYQRVFARRITESILTRDGEVITGLWSRQSGKTETIADVSIGLAVLLPALAKEFPDDERFKSFSRGLWVGIFAPILEQALICYNRMREKLESTNGETILSDPEIGIQVTTNRGDTCAFSNGSYIRARSASPDSQIEGGTFHVVILEEAQRLSRSKVNKEISPMLASTNGTMIKIGTAYMSKGGFHTDIQYNVEAHKNGGRRNHFEFPYDVVIKEKRARYQYEQKEAGVGNSFHLNYEAWIEKEIRKLGGVDSDEFKMNFRLLWQETRLSAVKSGPFYAAAMDGHDGRPVRERGMQPPEGWIVVAGLDVGKSNDSSLLTVAAVDPKEIWENDGFAISHPSNDESHKNAFSDERTSVSFHVKWILDWLEMQGEFEGNAGQYQTVLEFLKRFPKPAAMAIDSTGIGDAVAERFGVLLPDVQIIPIKWSAPSKHLLYKYYLNELHSNRIQYPAGPMTKQDNEFQKFQQEHMDLDKRLVGSYTLVSASDPELHDDYPDSAALMAWAEKEGAFTGGMEEIEETDSPFVAARSQRAVVTERSGRYRR